MTGSATKTGPDGNGYEVTLPSKWLVEHAKQLADGMRIAKIACTAGRFADGGAGVCERSVKVLVA